MAIPAQLKKQIEDTEEFYKPEDGVEDATQVDGGAGAQAEDSTVSDTTPITATDETPTEDLIPLATEVSEETPSGTTSEQQPATISEEEFNALQRRHSSLQGMFNSSDSRLRQAMEQIDQLRAAISTLQAPAQQASGTPTPRQAGGTEPLSTGVTKEEIKEYSPEFFDMLDRYTAAKLGPVRNQLDSMQQIPEVMNHFNDRLQGITSAQTQTSEQVFFDSLIKTHPDWEVVNTSREFADWLQTADPYNGITRQVSLDEARKRLDLNHVNNIFNGFKSERTPTGTAIPNKSQKRAELQQQASILPSKNQAKTPILQGAAKTFSKADLDKLYVDERMGKYKGKEAEFKAYEGELLQAITDGRYTG